MGKGKGWNIHLRDGTTLTEKDCVPHRADIQDEITSLERIEGPVVFSIKHTKALHFFFAKRDASQDMSPFSGKVDPAKVELSTIGVYVLPNKKPVRLDLMVVPGTTNVRLVAIEVDKIRKDGLGPTGDPKPK